MNCSTCSQKAVYSNPDLCSDHLVEYVITTVEDTIKRFDMCTKQQAICVAASGGKDSVSLLDILHYLGYQVHALAVDEGIKDYRDKSLVFLKNFCKQRNIPLKIVSFQDLTSKPLDDMVQGRHPCSVCGVFRRYLLNKYAQGFDVIATGHNLDDESQAVLMNLIKANTDLLLRTYAKSPARDGFVVRVKPFIFLPERMIAAYSFIKGFGLSYDECPYAHQSLRSKVRDSLNRYEQTTPQTKLKLLEAALRLCEKQSPISKQDFCVRCGQPSVASVCRACSLIDELKAGITTSNSQQ